MAKAKKLPSGNWRTQVYDYTDSNGKKHYKSFTAKTKKESEYKASYFALSKHDIDLSMTVGEAIQLYIDSKSKTLSPTTIRGYISCNKNMCSLLHHVKLKDLNKPKIQSWVGEISVNRDPKTVSNGYGLLTATLNYFEVPLSLKNIKLPQQIKKDIYVPTDNDVFKLLDYIKEKRYSLYIACLLAAFGTLRRSEICALERKDVKGLCITVNKSMVQDLNDEWIIKPVPKNDSSNRTVEYPQFVIDALPEKGHLVKLTPDSVTEGFSTCLKKLDIPHFRFHDLRHYSASIMHAIGVPDVYIMERGGWSSDKTLKKIYRNSLSDYQEKYTTQTNEYFEKVSHEISHE